MRILNRRRGAASIAALTVGATVVDVTSAGPEPWVRLSPFYPHGGIPVPFSPGVTGASVEGIWQALKVFDGTDVDRSKLAVTSMSGLKRTVRKLGPVRGHRRGVDGTELLAYEQARREIYLPCYRWVLEHPAAGVVAQLRALDDVVLLDYNTNTDITDLSKPLSHAGLLALYLADDWPA